MSDPAADAARLFAAAVARQNAGDPTQAYELYLGALNNAPTLADAYNNLGLLLKQSGRAASAIACLHRALQLAPNKAHFWSNLGNALWWNGEFGPAKVALEKSLALDAGAWASLHNYGLLLHSIGDFPRAMAIFDHAIALAPKEQQVSLRWDRALTILASGDLARGFAEYESRIDYRLTQVRHIPLPLWRGEDLSGKRIYVYAEQGLGDTVQFVRFLPLLKARGPRVILDCPSALIRLFEGLAGVDELRIQGSPLPAADCHVPLLSLPLHLGTTLATIPAETPYLAPPGGTPSLPRAAPAKVRIGIVWAGDSRHENDRNRSMTLEPFLGLCELPGVALYSLQAGPRSKDVRTSGAEAVVRDLSPLLRDMADTAGLIAQLDLVVAVDTAVVHLAGALNKPCWLLLPYAPDWRWLRAREDSPWYPSLRLFRQETPGDWPGVLRRVIAALAERLG